MEVDIVRLVGTRWIMSERKRAYTFKEDWKKDHIISRVNRCREKSSVATLASMTDKMSIKLQCDLLSILPLNTEQLKVAYGYFYDGKLPGEVVKDTGFHLLAVEIEYSRFIRTDK